MAQKDQRDETSSSRSKSCGETIFFPIYILVLLPLLGFIVNLSVSARKRLGERDSLFEYPLKVETAKETWKLNSEDNFKKINLVLWFLPVEEASLGIENAFKEELLNPQTPQVLFNS